MIKQNLSDPVIRFAFYNNYVTKDICYQQERHHHLTALSRFHNTHSTPCTCPGEPILLMHSSYRNKLISKFHNVIDQVNLLFNSVILLTLSLSQLELYLVVSCELKTEKFVYFQTIQKYWKISQTYSCYLQCTWANTTIQASTTSKRCQQIQHRYPQSTRNKDKRRRRQERKQKQTDMLCNWCKRHSREWLYGLQ